MEPPLEMPKRSPPAVEVRRWLLTRSSTENGLRVFRLPLLWVICLPCGSVMVPSGLMREPGGTVIFPPYALVSGLPSAPIRFPWASTLTPLGTMMFPLKSTRRPPVSPPDEPFGGVVTLGTLLLGGTMLFPGPSVEPGGTTRGLPSGPVTGLPEESVTAPVLGSIRDPAGSDRGLPVVPPPPPLGPVTGFCLRRSLVFGRLAPEGRLAPKLLPLGPVTGGGVSRSRSSLPPPPAPLPPLPPAPPPNISWNLLRMSLVPPVPPSPPPPGPAEP